LHAPLKAQPKGKLMPTYRVYFVGRDDHFHGATTVECDTDDEACARALEQIGTFPAVEVWCGTKAVGRVALPGEGMALLG